MTNFRNPPKMTGLQIRVSEKVKATLDRQARQRSISTALWIDQVFNLGLTAVCAREKSLPLSDADLDQIVEATLLLRQAEGWNPERIAKGLGVSKAVVENIIAGWKSYKAGCRV